MISTNKLNDKLDDFISVNQAILTGLPKNGGLWIPKNIPKIKKEWLDKIDQLTILEICNYILELYFYPDIPKNKIKEFVQKSINFNIPIHKLNDNNFILELIHGPTMAFKDFGARIMAQVFQYLISIENKTRNKKYKVIVATSGDTGGAVANAFSITDVPVYIFYPKNKISNFQEKQITAYGKNISCFCVDGNFDDCQKIVKDILLEKEINNKIQFITANSINISRLIPQIFYYFISYSKLKRLYGNSLSEYKIIYSVPSGNFGNSTAALMAKIMGLPIYKILIATNANDSLSYYLKIGIFNDRKSIETLSNAMDVGNPSNFKRIVYLCNNDIDLINQHIITDSINDEDTIDTIKNVYKKYKYLMDPHTAVGYKCIEKLYEQVYGLEDLSKNSIFNTIKDKIKDTIDTSKIINITLATASPFKFKNTVEKAINKKLNYPENFEKINELKPYFINYHQRNMKIMKKLIMNEVIILIGMPGSGKSTIAEKLNNLYGWNLIETDQLIIKKFKMKLIDIVNKLGNKFIIEETNSILGIKNIKKKTVISTGGSVVYSSEAMDFLSKLGVIIHLESNINDISKRLGNYLERGIVIEKGETLNDLFKKREILYHKYRDLSINNSFFNITESTNLINSLL